MLPEKILLFSLSEIESGAFWLPKLLYFSFTLMVWGEAGEFGGEASPLPPPPPTNR